MKNKTLQVAYIVCLLLCTSCFDNVIKYDCDTHSIYREYGIELHRFSIEYNDIIFYFAKKTGFDTHKVDLCDIYNNFEVDTSYHSGSKDSVNILPNTKYIITHYSNGDAVDQSIIIYTDSVGNFICPN